MSEEVKKTTRAKPKPVATTDKPVETKNTKGGFVLTEKGWEYKDGK